MGIFGGRQKGSGDTGRLGGGKVIRSGTGGSIGGEGPHIGGRTGGGIVGKPGGGGGRRTGGGSSGNTGGAGEEQVPGPMGRSEASPSLMDSLFCKRHTNSYR